MVGVTKAVSERFGHGGIADRMIYLNGYPFLDNKEEHTFGVPVSQVMVSHPVSIPATGLDLRQVERIMTENQFQGFPIVEDANSKILIGYIGRTELRYAIDRAKRDQMAPGHAKCFFGTVVNGADARTPSSTMPSVSFDTMSATSGQLSVDLSKFIDPTPLTVHPRLPLETVMELFSKMGPRVIVIEYRGKLVGLVTVKDCLKYQFKVEAHENPHSAGTVDAREDKLWNMIKTVAGWVNGGYVGARKRMGLGGQQQIRLESPVAARTEERGRDGGDESQVELEDRGGGGGGLR